MANIPDFISDLARTASYAHPHEATPDDDYPLGRTGDMGQGIYALPMTLEEANKATECAITRRKAPVYDSPDFRGGCATSHLAEVLKPPTVPFRQTARPNDIRIHKCFEELDTTPILVFGEKQDAITLKLVLLYYCVWGLEQPIVYAPRPKNQDSYGVMTRDDNRVGNLVFMGRDLDSYKPKGISDNSLTAEAIVFKDNFLGIASDEFTSRCFEGSLAALVTILFGALHTAPTHAEGYQTTAFTTTPFVDGYCVISTNIARGSAWGISLVNHLDKKCKGRFIPINTITLPAYPEPTPSASFVDKRVDFQATAGLTFDTFAVPDHTDARIINGLLPANFSVV